MMEDWGDANVAVGGGGSYCISVATTASHSSTMQMCKAEPVRAAACGSRAVELDQEQRPLRIVRASHQYLYDSANQEYLDCINSASHVGHCHPAVSQAASLTMDYDMCLPGWHLDLGQLKYPAALQQYLPPSLNTLLFCNSGSEAVDLAVQLSQLYTRGTDVIVTDNAFHGSTDSVHNLSPKISKANKTSKADWVHILTMPDLYRGPYQRDDPLAVNKYLCDAREVIDQIQQNGRKVASFLAEPFLVMPGCIMPPSEWLQEVYKMVRELGGLCIADEVQAGLGRAGSHFWSFQAQGVLPDILIIGKSIGNGYPMSTVATSKDIASVLGERMKEYQCSRLTDAVGSTVLQVLQEENLIESAARVGRLLKTELTKLMRKHNCIGDVRGNGLVLGIEVVWNKESKKPAEEIAKYIVHRMQEEQIILANEGQHRNILMLIPPMCFGENNVLQLVQRLDKVLSHLPSLSSSSVANDSSPAISNLDSSPSACVCEGRIGMMQPQAYDEDDNNDGALAPQDIELGYKQYNYQDLD